MTDPVLTPLPIPELEPVRFFYTPDDIREVVNLPDSPLRRLCVDLMLAAPQRDALTGNFNARYLPHVIENMQRWIEEEKRTSSGFDAEVIGFPTDIGNLRGANIALSGKKGHEDIHSETANRLLAAICQTEDQALESSMDHMLALRSSGDERYCVGIRARNKEYPLTPEEAARKANREVHKLVVAAGLGDIEHHKHKRQPHRRGVSLGCSPVTFDLPKRRDGWIAQLEAAEHSVEEMKLRSQDRRGGEPRPGQVDLRRELPAKLHKKLNPAQLEIAAAEINRRYVAPSQPPEFPPLPAGGDVAKDITGLDPASERHAAIEEWARAHDLKGTDLTTLRYVYSLFEQARRIDRGVGHDELIDYRARTTESVETVLARYGRLGGPPITVIAVRQENFAGLNDRYGHEGCNYVFGKMTQQLDNIVTTKSNQPLTVYPGGSGNVIYTFIPNATPELIADTRKSLIEENIRNEMQWVDGMKEYLENPRYPKRKGARISTAVVNLQDEQLFDPAAVLDKIKTELNNTRAQDEYWRKAGLKTFADTLNAGRQRRNTER